MIVDPCWNQPISSPLHRGTSKGTVRGPSRRRSRHASKKVEADACHQDGRDGNQCDGMAGAGKPGPDQGPLVLAEQAFDALESDRIDVPCIAGDIGDRFHTAVMRRMEVVIHGRCKPQCHIASVPVERRRVRRHRAGPAIDRESPLSAGPGRPCTAPDAPTIASQGLTSRSGSASIGTRAVPEPTDEAIMQAAEAIFARIAQVQIGEQAPDTDRQIADQRMLDLAEPAEEAGCQSSWDAVGQQEIDVFLLGDLGNRGTQPFHDIGLLPKQGMQRPWN